VSVREFATLCESARCIRPGKRNLPGKPVPANPIAFRTRKNPPEHRPAPQSGERVDPRAGQAPRASHNQLVRWHSSLFLTPLGGVAGGEGWRELAGPASWSRPPRGRS